MDNISDIPQLSTNEKAGLKGAVTENGRIPDSREMLTIFTKVGNRGSTHSLTILVQRSLKNDLF